MFGKKQINERCDAACRAAALRDELLVKVASQGPRL